MFALDNNSTDYIARIFKGLFIHKYHKTNTCSNYYIQSLNVNMQNSLHVSAFTVLYLYDLVMHIHGGWSCIFNHLFSYWYSYLGHTYDLVCCPTTSRSEQKG